MAERSVTSEKQPVFRTVREILGYNGEDHAVLLSLAQVQGIDSQTCYKAKPDFHFISMFSSCI